MAKSMVRASGAGAEAKIITVGERVIVHFDGLGWCAGAITKHKANGNYSIQFDDGTFEPDVGKDEPRRAGKASGPYPDGARVVVKFPNAGWYAGVVESLVEIDRESDQPVATYAVQFDDGDHHGDVISLQMLPEGASVASRGKRMATGPDTLDDLEFQRTLEGHCKLNDRLMARDVGGIWCAAKVIDVSDSPEGRRLKIHFKGFGARHDEWITLGTGRLRPPPGIECSVGDSYEACDRNGKWCEAKVVEIEDAPDGRRLKVHFMGFGAKHDEWITLGTERLRPLSFGTNVAVGGRVHARDKLGIWAEGKVLEVRENPRQLKVHFLGFKSRFDEWITVGTGRLLPSRDGAKAAAKEPAKGVVGATIGAISGPSSPRLDSSAAPAAPPPLEIASVAAPAVARPKKSRKRNRVAEDREELPALVNDSPPVHGETLTEPSIELSTETLSPTALSAVAAQRLLLFAQAPAQVAGVGNALERLPEAEAVGAVAAPRPDAAAATANGLPAAIKEGLEALRAQITCTVCARVLVQPRVLPCQHAFCEDCISAVLRATSPNARCVMPKCKQLFVRRDVKASPVLEGVVHACGRIFEHPAAVPK